MSEDKPDYKDDIAFVPQGDQSDARVVFHTDRTTSTIKLIDILEQIKTENKQLKELLQELNVWFFGMIGSMNNEYSEHNRNIPVGNFEYAMRIYADKITEVLNADIKRK